MACCQIIIWISTGSFGNLWKEVSCVFGGEVGGRDGTGILKMGREAAGDLNDAP